jgi:hypothetical protein
VGNTFIDRPGIVDGSKYKKEGKHGEPVDEIVG